MEERSENKHALDINKFSESSRKVLQISQEAAIKLNNKQINDPHLLIGLLSIRSIDSPHGIFSQRGITLEKTRNVVAFIASEGPPIDEEISGLTDSAKKVIELAVEDFRRRKELLLTPFHLARGLIINQGDATRIIVDMGANLDDLMEALDKGPLLRDPLRVARQGYQTHVLGEDIISVEKLSPRRKLHDRIDSILDSHPLKQGKIMRLFNGIADFIDK